MSKALRTAPGGVVEKAALMLFSRGDIMFARTRGKKIYFNIGGKRKKRESRKRALIRETKEETGVDLIPETIRFYAFFRSAQCPGYVSGTPLRMYCYTAKHVGTPRAQKGDKVDKLRRLGVRHIGKNLTTPMGEQILRTAASRGHISRRRK